MAPVQLLLSLHQLLLLLREGDVLVQGLLVNVGVFLQLLVSLVQLFEELFLRHVLVLVKGVSRQGAQLPDFLGALLNLLLKDSLLAGHPLQLLAVLLYLVLDLPLTQPAKRSSARVRTSKCHPIY